MPTDIIPHDEILQLHAAIVSADLTHSRNALLAGLDPSFVAGLPNEGPPSTALLNDLVALNSAGALSDRSVPLQHWLQNAVLLAGPRREAAIFRAALEHVKTWKALSPTAARPKSPAAPPAASPTVGADSHGSPSRGVVPGARATGAVELAVGAGAAPSSPSASRPYEAEPAIDFAVLTAVEVERRAVCAAFNLTKEHRVRKSGRWYWRGRVPLQEGGFYEIVVAQPADMGQIEAAGLTKDVLRDWKPRAALLVGIAASADPEKIKLGDVVVGRAVWYYEHGRVTPAGMKPQPEMMPADAGLLQHLTGMDDWNGEVAAERPDGTAAKPKVYAGVIASGEKMIADAAARDEIASGHRKIIAVAMEDYGFSRAVWQSFEHVHHLIIRGICDEASATKDDGWQPYAAAAAAAFAKHFLLDRPL
ncbi:MAG: hypothetical protein U0359_15050 [Byssovorax sp.]